MQDFLNSYSFILAFLVSVAILEAAAGEKVTNYFLLLVLISMLIVNANSFTNFLKKLRTQEKG